MRRLRADSDALVLVNAYGLFCNCVRLGKTK